MDYKEKKVWIVYIQQKYVVLVVAVVIHMINMIIWGIWCCIFAFGALLTIILVPVSICRVGFESLYNIHDAAYIHHMMMTNGSFEEKDVN